MRLWHKDLISVLPRQQLIAQWRECCAIASNIANKGSPNHRLVNKVMEYPINHFNYYGQLVGAQMCFRGYSVDSEKFDKWLRVDKGNGEIPKLPYPYPEYDELFKDWHNGRYLYQCYYNLQEKYDCGIIDENEWQLIDKKVKEISDNNDIQVKRKKCEASIYGYKKSAFRCFSVYGKYLDDFFHSHEVIDGMTYEERIDKIPKPYSDDFYKSSKFLGK